jgi:hypothetical protein
MPAEPIKHGTKARALCHACAGCPHVFKTCTGKGSAPGSSPKGATSRLLHGAGATGTSGHVLHADDSHASLTVMKHVFTLFSMLLVGACALTKKKSRTAADFPLAQR